LRDIQVAQQLFEQFAVFGAVQILQACTQDRDALF
jgi:hypothetical protein